MTSERLLTVVKMGSSPIPAAKRNNMFIIETIFELIEKTIRENITEKKKCEECLSAFTWQTKDGRMLCDRHYRRHCEKTKVG